MVVAGVVGASYNLEEIHRFVKDLLASPSAWTSLLISYSVIVKPNPNDNKCLELRWQCGLPLLTI